jgi:hypothetical protein
MFKDLVTTSATVLTILKMRMGKGKGSFDHWATRVAVNQIVFELRGVLHEQVIRDAFRLAGNKLPGESCTFNHFPQLADFWKGQYEVVKKGDPPVVGITKLEGITMEELKRPRKKLEAAEALSIPPSIANIPSKLPAAR